MMIVNSICFGLAHLFYGNWVAPILSGLGGLLFCHRYLKSKSLLVVGLEHGLWGDFLFTVGLGWFFYSGAIQ
jgi:membrane protease YdiL (CAAX protease family)